MIQAAKALNARVRGDDFKAYRTVNQWYKHPDDVKKEIEQTSNSKKLKLSARSREWLMQIALVSTVASITYAVSWMNS